MEYIVKRIWYVNVNNINEAIKASKNWNHSTISIEKVGPLTFNDKVNEDMELKSDLYRKYGD